MPDTNFRGKQGSFRLALVVSSLLWLALLLPATAWARGHTVYVPPPNGVDDTANIQTALDACVAYGPGCTVQLAAGTYLTRQLVEYHFQGTFRGMGIDSTTVQALPNLPVTINQDPSEEPQCQPNTTTCIWPSLVIFADGNIHVSDLTFNIPGVPATQPWFLGGSSITMMFEALGFRGQYPQYPTHVWIDRIRIEGQPDNSPANWGFNVMMGAHFAGELPRGPKLHDYYFLSGSFTVRNSDFSTLFVGISQDGFVKSSQITIGGSPSAGNHLENGYGGLDIESSEHSAFDVSYNESSGMYAGMWVVPWNPVFVPSSPSRYLIHDNKLIGTAQYGDGMYLLDDPTNPWIQAAVWNNTIELRNTLMEGIGAYNTKGTAIWNNTVTGMNGNDAIGLWSSTLSTVIGNNVTGFPVDPTGYAQIYLDPSTAHDLVVCAEPSDTVLNQGTDNMVIGCQRPTATSETAAKTATPAASNSKPDVLKRKPWLR